MTTIGQPPSVDATCQSCGESLAPGTQRCSHCGAPSGATSSPVRCATCGIETRPGARFCTSCGGVLPQPQPATAGHPRVHIPRRIAVAAAVAAVGAVAIAAVVVIALRRGGDEAGAPTIPVPAVVTPDMNVVEAMHTILAGMPPAQGANDRERVRSLLGPPDAFQVSFEPANGGRGDQLLRYETWYYFELESAFEFVDADLLSNLPVDDVNPLAILPRQYRPEMFERDMTLDDVKALVAAPAGLVQIDAPPELGAKMTAYYGEQLMVVFDEGGLALVETRPLQRGTVE